MPITSSAKKAMRRDKRRQEVNYKIRAKVKKAVDTIRRGSTDSKDISKLQSVLDRAAKTRVIHPKKASRLKSRLNKFAKSKAEKPATKKATAKKTTAKKKAKTAK